MTFQIKVEHRGVMIIDAVISEAFGRTLTLIGFLLPSHLERRPEDSDLAFGKIAHAIESALQENSQAHHAWEKLCKTPTNDPAIITVVNQIDVPASSAAGRGGRGGDAAWPAGGGGGGGGGSLGSVGGNGAGGAIAVFLYNSDRQLVDIETFVTSGSADWTVPKGISWIEVCMFGGGGGGGGALPVA